MLVHQLIIRSHLRTRIGLELISVSIVLPDPTFCDIEADGDLDLFIGDANGNIWFYRNDGDSANYNYIYVTDHYLILDAGDYASPNSPT